ncbi:apolipoprotein D and lipocalin family protein [Yoonia tamlensis]|uniref:Outer membrane lipoprotein Blc n=1 Tax=Yoonia tamlensis TaxID=390270 RepID=A0A1I6FW35_9RHOB|nr:lipocalin family protein [Yoonia tamlensis]SFR34096.1 apolipoprotein D and lipocalin family protein [Yoonia tamlensis]
MPHSIQAARPKLRATGTALRALAVLGILAGCAAVVPASTYRDAGVPISSKAFFEPDRYIGLWHEVARFPVPFQSDCPRATAEYGLQTDGSLSVRNICRNADGSEKSRITGSATITGPGRLVVRFDGLPFIAADYWVLWVDEGYRTAVVGSPNGRSGWILNRDPEIPPDRLRAARDILRFNGYDVSQLMEMTP